MPNYHWKCRVCGDDTEVRRPIDKYDVPPDSETETDASCVRERGHDWERLVSGGQLVFGLGIKGNWGRV